LQTEANAQTTSDRDAGMVAKPIMQSLSPLTIDEFKDDIGACCHTGGSRARVKGVLPMSVANYLVLLDRTARELRADKRGATPESAQAKLKMVPIQKSAAEKQVLADTSEQLSKLLARKREIDGHIKLHQAVRPGLLDSFD